MSTRSDLTCLACLEETRAALANGRLGPMCSGCQKDYDENTRGQPKRKCSQCRQMWPEFEFNRKGVTVKVCSFCRAEFSARARHAQLSRPPREKGVMDADLRMAYVKLYRSHKDGQDEPGAMIGPVIDELVAAGNAEPVGNGCYRITDAGITAWAHIASQTAGKFDLDSQELMERAGWIMSVRQLLEALEDESWQALKVKIAYDVRKAARDDGLVEVSGHTSGQMWHITNAGVAELERLRAEDAQAEEDATEDPEPEGYVEAVIEIDWQQIAADRLAHLEALKQTLKDNGILYLSGDLSEDEITSLKVALDAWRKSPLTNSMVVDISQDLAQIDAMAAAERSPLRGIDYVKDLRQRLDDLGNYEDPDMVQIIGWAIADGAGEISPAEYVQGLRQQVDFINDDVKVRLTILDELWAMTPAIRCYIEARQMTDANRRAIVNGRAK